MWRWRGLMLDAVVVHAGPRTLSHGCHGSLHLIVAVSSTSPAIAWALNLAGITLSRYLNQRRRHYAAAAAAVGGQGEPHDNDNAAPYPPSFSHTEPLRFLLCRKGKTLGHVRRQQRQRRARYLRTRA
ncbi:hypothetical protein EDB84DRAFT_1681822, partial [Lactarius hengduanensis]